MPVHDWRRVDTGVFYSFRLGWMSALCDRLNRDLLPSDHYALLERDQVDDPDFDLCRVGAAIDKLDSNLGRAFTLLLNGYDPGPAEAPSATDIAEPTAARSRPAPAVSNRSAGIGPPPMRPTATSGEVAGRRSRDSLVIRRAEDDKVVSVMDVMSADRKASRHASRRFLDRATTFLTNGVHLLIVDLFPPGRRDPDGLHAAIWEDVTDQPEDDAIYRLPADKPLAAMAYEVGTEIRAYVQPMAVGEAVPSVPLFLAANACVAPPLDDTYRTAFGVMSRRWRDVLEPPAR